MPVHQGFKSGNSTGINNSDPQGTKQGQQHVSSSHKQHSSIDPQFPSTAEEHASHRDIPSNAQHSGAVTDHLHDITKAERALHEGLRHGRIREGDTVSGDGHAPGGPTHLPK